MLERSFDFETGNTVEMGKMGSVEKEGGLYANPHNRELFGEVDSAEVKNLAVGAVDAPSVPTWEG